MILQRVDVAVLDGHQAAFEAALCEVRRRVFTARGFRGFEVAQGLEFPATYLVQVLWESPEELADFAGSGRFERSWAPVEAFLAGPLRVDHYVERPGLAFRGPGVITDLDLGAESSLRPGSTA